MSDLEDLIARFARSLDPIDRVPFREAAEVALADLPEELVGPRTVFRAVESAWAKFFVHLIDT